LTTGAASITEPLPLSQRAAFLEALAAELERYPAEARGHGLLHRLGRELQRTFLKNGPVAVGGSFLDSAPLGRNHWFSRSCPNCV
jgi:hypothetical protein